MPQKEIIHRGEKKLLITVSLKCSEWKSGRIQLKRTFSGIEKGSKKARFLEMELVKEAERKRTIREQQGSSWETLLNKYELYAWNQIKKNNWTQSRQTFEEGVNALHNWTKHWFRMPASSISAADVTKLFHSMRESDRSESTIIKLRSDIKKVFDFGILFDHVKGISKSPTTGVTVKSRKRRRSEILRDDEIVKLLSYAKKYEPTWYHIWSFAVYTGMRNGELYSLKWTDINFEEKMITVQRSYNKRYRIEKSTKTDEWRYVSICDALWKNVLELQEIREHEIARKKCKNPDYVLPRPGRWQNGEQAEVIRNFCIEIGITPICFHTLRACFATELLKRGVTVPSVMRVGGWTSIKTMMHYVRLSGVQDKGITDPLDYRSETPTVSNRKLMAAVGDKFGSEDQQAQIIPISTRKHPGLGK